MALTAINTDALIITEVRTLIGEPTARRMTDTEIKRWLNMGLDTIQTRNLAYETIISVQLVADDDDYTLSPASVISVAAVIYSATSVSAKLEDGAKGLLRMHPRHYNHIRGEATGPPQEYFFFGGELRLWPTPVTAQATHYIKIFCYTRELTFGGNDIANLKDYYHQYVVWYAYAMALKKLGKMEQAYQYMSYFNNFIDFHKQSDLVKPVDSQDMMNLPDQVQFI